MATPRLFDLSKKATVDELKETISRTVKSSDCPLASTIQHNIPVYDCSQLDVTAPKQREELMTELYNMLLHGPGVLVLKHMYPDHSILDDANAAFAAIIEKERATSKGDHFSSAATNSRIWNSFSKHCLESPSSFLSYYQNPWLPLICEAYLGPAYRITTQVNIVHPKGAAQTCHRDYHLGFQTEADASRWPRAMHLASQLLTLQGAVAHTDMPLPSGPTRLLPFTQHLEDGYIACRDPELRNFFERNWVSLPLEKGDGLFFNPALFHAAGENTTDDFHRSANLIQISSAFGKPMEIIDALPLVDKTWDALREKVASEGVSPQVIALVHAIGEGYPFPTNLDRRPPAPGGMAPETEQGLMLRGLKEGWDRARIMQEFETMREASKA